MKPREASGRQKDQGAACIKRPYRRTAFSRALPYLPPGPLSCLCITVPPVTCAWEHCPGVSMCGTGSYGKVSPVQGRGMTWESAGLMWPGDNIVGVRAASRDQPSGLLPASLKLSMSSGVILDSNTARQEMDRLRKALNWEVR